MAKATRPGTGLDSIIGAGTDTIAGTDSLAAVGAADTLAGGPTTVVAAAGTVDAVANPGQSPVVLGAAEVPIEQGGPGAGSLRVATETKAFETRPLERIDEAPLSAAERAELETLRRRAGIRGMVVDAASIPGQRVAQAATTIKRDGRSYAPGSAVPLDYEGYVELVAIGAITNVPWAELELADD